MSSKIIGASFLVAGTSIGAGMIGLPMASSGIGFAISSIEMILIWAVMYISAMVMIDLSTFFKAPYSIPMMAEKAFGKKIGYVASFFLLFLFYSLLVAYILGGSQILLNYASLPFPVVCLIYTAIFGGIVYFQTKWVDYLNRFLFTKKVVVFLGIILLLLPFVHKGDLLKIPSSLSLSPCLFALPIFFTSFGFHGSIPSLVEYLDQDEQKLKKAILLGSLIPLVVYLLWQGVTLGTLSDASQMTTGNVGTFVSHLNQKVQNPWLLVLIPIFTFLAIVTSFLGVSVGLFDYWRERLQKPRSFVWSLVFIPPLLFAIVYPDGFLMALGYAGIALSFLAILLPVMIAKFYAKCISTVTFIVLMLSGSLIVVIELVKSFL